jgi:LCP family protein required for cell wall assembly
MNQDRTEQLIRDVFADQAARAVDGRDVLEALQGKPRRRYGLALATAAVVVVVAAVATFVIPEVFRRSSPTPPVAEQQTAAVTPTSVLVVGVDANRRTDTVVLSQIHADGGVSLVSLPRDSWVQDPTGAMVRLNRVYEVSGAEALLATVRDLTGVMPEHYAVVDMRALADLTNAVGGVPVCLNAAVQDDYSGADFPAGEQVLSGDAALAFVRQRHGLFNGDLDRVKRHQALLQGIGTKLGDADLPALADAVRGRITTDPDLDLLGLAQALAGATSVHVGTIPVIDTNHQAPGGGSVITVDPGQVKEFVGGIASTPPAGGVPCVD